MKYRICALLLCAIASPLTPIPFAATLVALNDEWRYLTGNAAPQVHTRTSSNTRSHSSSHSWSR